LTDTTMYSCMSKYDDKVIFLHALMVQVEILRVKF
jgi:hypothetical protein